jgi:hypothetical protein
MDASRCGIFAKTSILKDYHILVLPASFLGIHVLRFGV